MRKNSSSLSGLFIPRLLLALLLCFSGLFLGVFSETHLLGASAGKTKLRSTDSRNISSGDSIVTPNDPLSCTAPGTLIVTDPTGDQTGAPAADQQFDIQSVSIAEPCFTDGIDRLAFTIKVATLSSIPANGHWKVQFVPPVLPSGVTAYFVEMTSDQNSNVSYAYGTVGTTTTTVGTADNGSNSADGTITITVANNKVGNPMIGQAITTIQGRTQLLVGAAGTGLLETIDSTTVTGTNPSYTVSRSRWVHLRGSNAYTHTDRHTW